jgi:hypothetical protein
MQKRATDQAREVFVDYDKQKSVWNDLSPVL